MSHLIRLAVLITVTVMPAIAFRPQTVGVRGVLRCGNDALSDAMVKLWDKDSVFDPDDLLAMSFTNAVGFFNLSGTEKELTSIDPRLSVYHNCDNSLPCKREATFKIPEKYIYGKTREEIGVDMIYFDIGTVNMEARFEDETRQCF